MTASDASAGAITSRVGGRVRDALVGIATVYGIAATVIPGAMEQAAIPLGVLVIAGLLLCLPVLSRRTGVVVLALLAAGAVASAAVGASPAEMAAGLAMMATLFAFIVAVRLVEFPVTRRGYDVALAEAAAAFRPVRGSWTAAAAVTYMLSMALSFAAVPMAYRAIRRMDGSEKNAGAAGLVCRSFIAGNVWTPTSPLVAFALTATGVSWLHFLPYGIGLSITAIALMAVGPRPSVLVPSEPVRRSRVMEFLALVVLILTVVVAIEMVLPKLTQSGATILAVLLVVPSWELIGGGAKVSFHRALADAVAEAQVWREQFALFSGGGLLVAAALHWGRAYAVGGHVMSQRTVVLLLVATPLAIAGLGLVGLYPMVGLLVLATVLPHVDVHIPRVLVASATLLGAAVGFVGSPFSGLTLLVSGLAGDSSYRVALEWNRAFAALFLAVGTAGIGLLAVVS